MTLVRLQEAYSTSKNHPYIYILAVNRNKKHLKKYHLQAAFLAHQAMHQSHKSTMHSNSKYEVPMYKSIKTHDS